MYSPIVHEHFNNPRNGGKPESFSVKGVAGNPNAGPFMVIYLEVHDSRIQEAHFQTYGCPAAIAAGSLVTEMVKGRTTIEAGKIDGAAIRQGLGGLPLGKEHCADIAAAALAEALREASDLPKTSGPQSTP